MLVAWITKLSLPLVGVWGSSFLGLNPLQIHYSSIVNEGRVLIFFFFFSSAKVRPMMSTQSLNLTGPLTPNLL